MLSDIDNLVKVRVIETPNDEYDYSTHERFIRKCGSYDEYLLKCYIEGVEPLVMRAEFDSIVENIKNNSHPFAGFGFPAPSVL